MARARRWSFQTLKPRVAIALTAQVLLLFIIGGYAVSFTFVDGLNLRAVRTLHERLYHPTDQLVSALQAERRASLELVGAEGDAGRKAVDTARAETGRTVETFRVVAADKAVRDAGDDTLRTRIDVLVTRLVQLDVTRQQVDAGQVSRTEAAARFSRIVDAAFGVFSAMPAEDQSVISDRHRTLVELVRGRELLSREDALLAGTLATGGLTAGDRDEFIRLVGARRFLFSEIEPVLADDQRAGFRRVADGGELRKLEQLEDKIAVATAETPPFSGATWVTTTGALTDQLTGLESGYAATMLRQSDAAASSVLWQGAITVLLGLLLVTVLMTVWLRVAPRHVIGQLNGLKEAALQLAHERLPRVVAKLQRGEHVDVNAEAPPLEFGPDEFGDVGRAFNAVQQTAVQAAVDQAALRHGIKDVFVNLARRSQGLVHRQLTMLDEMERRATDPDELERLFAIDHLATRMRRHAEDLIILSGSPPGRRWRKPVPLVDVVRAAVGEVESYSRVAILPVPQAALTGRVVADVIHLLAELIENATSLSPPHTKVQLTSQLVPSGFVVEIEDRGLGMSDADLYEYNNRLANPPEFNLSDTVRLGLFVVGRLAERHDIKVHLRRSPYGGTTAIVLIPAALVVTADAIEYDDTVGLDTMLTHTAVPASIRITPEPRPAELTRGPNTGGRHAQPSPGGRTNGEDPPLTAGSTPITNGQDRSAEPAAAPRMAPPAPELPWTDGSPRTRRPQPTPAKAAPTAASPTTEPTTAPTTAPTTPPTAPAAAADDEELLPRRVRQASLATELRDTPVAAPEAVVRERPPEQIRSMMTAFQRGSLRGRSDAERLNDEPNGSDQQPRDDGAS